MCIVSNKIKFCTCANGVKDGLKHYWILYRFNNSKNEVCMGETIMQTSMMDSNFELNRNTLLHRLNEHGAFDKPLELKPNDVLEITINNVCDINEHTFTYTFQYNNKTWHAIEEDPFELMNHYDQDASGKIRSALKRKKTGAT